MYVYSRICRRHFSSRKIDGNILKISHLKYLFLMKDYDQIGLIYSTLATNNPNHVEVDINLLHVVMMSYAMQRKIKMVRSR